MNGPHDLMLYAFIFRVARTGGMKALWDNLLSFLGFTFIRGMANFASLLFC